MLFSLQRWHYGAARSAQKWAEQCQLLKHDTPKGRWIENYGACGQNIFVSTHKVPWYDTLKHIVLYLLLEYLLQNSLNQQMLWRVLLFYYYYSVRPHKTSNKTSFNKQHYFL